MEWGSALDKLSAAMETFSVGLFLGSVGKDSYVPQFTSGEYVTLAKCTELTEHDLTSMGIPADIFFRSDYASDSKFH